MIAGRLLRTAHMAGTTYVESGCGQRAAAISYHVLFSLVPFLAVLLTVLDLVLPESPESISIRRSPLIQASVFRSKYLA